ncbi:hypothetical protein GUJ93_ZPchr0007g5993 [Zizania palustris]|uniref:Uncharacterized protein n=1 Tax=Zizania palustris TaxID=103762 RepID=A0A8J5T5X9_ZIZPA|nr:hypothetical protein GUJ93_ZPchr0007g5993 [Zizania palustris]
MRTIAKARRQVAEGKAAFQAEAAEWKRKYELEMAHKQQITRWWEGDITTTERSNKQILLKWNCVMGSIIVQRTTSSNRSILPRITGIHDTFPRRAIS